MKKMVNKKGKEQDKLHTTYDIQQKFDQLNRNEEKEEVKFYT